MQAFGFLANNAEKQKYVAMNGWFYAILSMQMDQMARTQCEQYESEMLSARFLEFFTMVVIRCRYEHKIFSAVSKIFQTTSGRGG